MALLLRAQIADLVEKDDRVFKAAARLKEIKGQRDRCQQELSDLIVSVRQVLKGIYKAPNLERLGLEGRTGRTVEHLLRQAGRLSAAADKDLTPILGEPRFNEGVDPRPQLLRIGRKADALEALARQLDEARRDRDETGVDRNVALAEYKKAHLASTQTFESWCRLAGEDVLSAKVRAAKPGRRKGDSTEENRKSETVSRILPEGGPSYLDVADALPFAPPSLSGTDRSFTEATLRKKMTNPSRFFDIRRNVEDSRSQGF